MVKDYKHSFIKSISSLEISKQFNQEAIQEIILKYPAFNAAYLLQAVVVNKENPEALKTKLTGIATKVLDRSLLHDYMHKNIFRFEKNIEEKVVFHKEKELELKDVRKDISNIEAQKIVESKGAKQYKKDSKNSLNNSKETKRDDAFSKLADDLFKDKIGENTSNLSEKEQRRISALQKLQEELFATKKKEISQKKDLSNERKLDNLKQNELEKNTTFIKKEVEKSISSIDLNKEIALKKKLNSQKIQALKEKLLLQKQKEQQQKEEEFKKKAIAESLSLKKKIEEQKEKEEQQLKLQINIRTERKRKEEEERILLREVAIKKEKQQLKIQKAKDLKEEFERNEKIKKEEKLKKLKEKRFKELEDNKRLKEIEKEKIISKTKEQTSFLDWLKNKNKKAQTKKVVEPKSIKKEHEEIPFDKVSAIEAEMYQEIKNTKEPLDTFIGMQIAKKKTIKKQLIKSEQSKVNQSVTKGFASETFAEILIAQQKYNEAIEVYSSLSLKYPKKSIYFARQIEKIKTYL